MKKIVKKSIPTTILNKEKVIHLKYDLNLDGRELEKDKEYIISNMYVGVEYKIPNESFFDKIKRKVFFRNDLEKIFRIEKRKDLASDILQSLKWKKGIK